MPEPTQDDFPDLSPRRRIFAIVALSIGTALAVIDGAIANVALPTISRALHAGQSDVVLIVTVYQLVLVMTLLPFSALGDRIGHHRLYFLGQFVFALASMLALVAHSLPQVLVMRVFQAIGAAASLSVSTALIRAIYPSHQLGRGMGVNTVVVTSMNALAPTIGGFVLSLVNWQAVFAVGTPFALLSMLIGFRSLPTTPRLSARYDFIAALGCAVGFGSLVSGLEIVVHAQTAAPGYALLAFGIAVTAAFVRRELSSSLPILPLDLMRNPMLALSAAGSFVAFIASMSLFVSLPFRLQHTYGFSVTAVGEIMAAWPLTMIVVAPAAGLLADRWPAGILGGIGMTVAAMAMLLLAFLPANPTLWAMMARMALAGVGFGLFLTPNARFLVGQAPRHRVATMGGFVSMTRLTGQTLGATLAAALLGLGLGNGPVAALLSCSLVAIAGLCSVTRLLPVVRH